MATYSDIKAIHQTLTGTTADNAQLLQYWDKVEISNRSGTSDISAVFRNTATSLGVGTEVIGPGTTKLIDACPSRGGGIPGSTSLACVTVSLVGNGNAYSVIGVAG
jgi:hypothetical protein